MGYGLRRTSARVVVALGAGGLLWSVSVMPSYRPPGLKATYPILFLWRTDPYRVVGSGLSSWDLAAAAVGVMVALVAAAALWYERPARR
jgi:hypothetical protein